MDHPPLAPSLVPAAEAPPARPVLTVLAPAAATGGAASVCRLQTPPHPLVGRHRHADETEIVTVLGGAIELQVGTEAPRTLGAGETATLPRGVPHAYVAADGGADLLVVFVPGGFERTLLRAVAPSDEPPLSPDDLAAHLASAGVTLLGPRG